jgi:hypothetical protein
LDWVRDDIAGLSSVLPLAALDENEQREAYEYMARLFDGGVTLTRERIANIVKGKLYCGGETAESENSETGKGEADSPPKVIHLPTAFEEEPLKRKKDASGKSDGADKSAASFSKGAANADGKTDDADEFELEMDGQINFSKDTDGGGDRDTIGGDSSLDDTNDSDCNISDTPRLKPCPFCGGAALRGKDAVSGAPMEIILCSNSGCGARTYAFSQKNPYEQSVAI